MEKVSSNTSQAYFVIIYKFNNIIKLYDIVSCILLRAIKLLIYKILNIIIFSLLYLALIKGPLYLKALQYISIILYNNQR